MSLARVLLRSRALHTSARRCAISEFQMPAMSPTMTEGGIAAWKVKEGGSFATGDVLLEIETDKATMDVEAQDDGIMGKIVMADGSKSIPVGTVIALLAEEGDDISNLEAPKGSSQPAKSSPPKEEQKSETKPAQTTTSSSPASGSPPSAPHPESSHSGHITSSHPLFPSVIRLLQENNVTDTKDIKGTGVRGMLTKGDVLAYLGKIKNPFGTWKEEAKDAHLKHVGAAVKSEAKKDVKPLDGPALRVLLAQGLAQLGKPQAAFTASASSFDSVVDDYLPKVPEPLPVLPVLPVSADVIVTVVPPIKRSTDYLEGLY